MAVSREENGLPPTRTQAGMVVEKHRGVLRQAYHNASPFCGPPAQTRAGKEALRTEWGNAEETDGKAAEAEKHGTGQDILDTAENNRQGESKRDGDDTAAAAKHTPPTRRMGCEYINGRNIFSVVSTKKQSELL